jgi:hypothetical protein
MTNYEISLSKVCYDKPVTQKRLNIEEHEDAARSDVFVLF